jgi:hypothetical protein
MGYQTVAQRNLTCAVRIKERRRELGLTQAEVVERVSRHGSRLCAGLACSGHGRGRNDRPRTLKWVAPLIRRGFVSEACEVDGAGGVEGFLGCAHW